MIVLDYRDPRPIYEQVVRRFRELILAGVLKENEQMPSVRSLAAELAINPNTIQRAYAELERQGFTYMVKGRGSFVSGSGPLREQHRAELCAQLRGLLQDAKRSGVPRGEVLGILGEAYPEDAAEEKGERSHA